MRMPAPQNLGKLEIAQGSDNANDNAASNLAWGDGSKTKWFLDELSLKQKHLSPGFRTVSLYTPREIEIKRKLWVAVGQGKSPGHLCPARKRLSLEVMVRAKSGKAK